MTSDALRERDVAAAKPVPVKSTVVRSVADERPALRFITCGSVDDGKSTLIGRLLWEQGQVFDDQFEALERDTRKHGTTGDAVDFALLVDGLEAERQQGITIDVAYRYFRTARRSFIVADTPGHEQFTRNMATGASNADLAVLLVDARKGLLEQTRRHATIVSLLGIRHVVLAVNKIDLIGYAQDAFDAIVAAFGRFAASLGFAAITAIPLSARNGDNLSAPSPRTPWYRGPALVAHLETVDVVAPPDAGAFRMPVQWINRPDLDFRGFAGTVAGGRVAPGDAVVVAGSGRTSTVARIMSADGDMPSAEAGDAVTLTLADEVDVARGDVFAAPQARPQVADGFAADLIWMGDEALRFGRSYLLKLAAYTVPATVSALQWRLDVDTLAQNEATTLNLNEVGRAAIATNAPVAFDTYGDNATTGGFILIDRESNRTVAAGMIREGLRRASNVHRHAFTVSRTDRARLKQHRPGVLWFTGLSGAGKSTIANRVEARLNLAGIHTALLDGDNIRHGLSRDLGFSQADRRENIRRVAEAARLMTDAGLVVLCCFISPGRAERALVRDTVGMDEFVEVYVDTPLSTCIARDAKGLYAQALAGKITDFTGVDQAYEAPVDPAVIVGRDGETAERAAGAVIDVLVTRTIIDRFDDLADWSI